MQWFLSTHWKITTTFLTIEDKEGNVKQMSTLYPYQCYTNMTWIIFDQHEMNNIWSILITIIKVIHIKSQQQKIKKESKWTIKFSPYCFKHTISDNCQLSANYQKLHWQNLSFGDNTNVLLLFIKRRFF